ncbi:hypothetical protein PFISCL1PPCAC_23732, partial [Pristionchus fissidentatus]
MKKNPPLDEAESVPSEDKQLCILLVRAARQKRLMSVAMKRSEKTTGAQLLGRTCMICRRVFENRCKLTLHQMEHKREPNPYKCALRGCPAAFPDYRQLRVHLITAHNGVMGAAVQPPEPVIASPSVVQVKEEIMD